MKSIRSYTGIWTMLVVIISSGYGNCLQDTTKLIDNSIGGELKGLYVAGGTAVIGGAALGIISNGFDDHPRSGLPFIAAGIGLAPASLLGVGLGSLLSRKHSQFFGSFLVGIGTSYSSPIFSEFVPGNSHRIGVNVSLLSPAIGRWRYSLSYSQYFAEEYVFDDIPVYRGQTNLSWWEIDLDLQYLIHNGQPLKIYPFIGTQMNQVNSRGSKLNSEILVNYGLGVNMRLINRFSLYAEAKYTIDPDNNPSNSIYKVGVLYALK